MGRNEKISTLREAVRLLERKLGMLNDIQSACCGVTFAQCHAIVEIGRAKRISLNELADILGLDKSTMSRTVNNLVNSHLAVRETEPKDRRYIMITLTEAGQHTFERIEAEMNTYFAQVYQRIPEGQRELVVESLHLLLRALAEYEDCQQC